MTTTEARGITSPAAKKTDPGIAVMISKAPVTKIGNGKINPKARPLIEQAGLVDPPAKKKPKPAAKKPKAVKNAKPTKKAKASKPRQRGEGPSGRVVEILKLASRTNGVSREELNALTKWSGAPWKWLFMNPKGTGYCDRWGYTLRVIEGKEGETRYVTTKR